MRACAPPFSWVYFSTSISPIRYRSFANTALRTRSIIVHPHLYLSLLLSLSLFLVLRASRCSFTLFHIFIAARCRHIHVLRFCVPSPPPSPPSRSHRENLSLLLSRPFFSTLSFRPSFFVPLLISLDRIDLFTCTAAITISSPGLFFVRSFLRSLKTN